MSYDDPNGGHPGLVGSETARANHAYYPPQPNIYYVPQRVDLFDKIVTAGAWLAGAPIALTMFLVLGHAVAPSALDPARLVGGFIGSTDAAAIDAHTAATANLQRQTAIANAQAETLHDTNKGNEMMAVIGTLGCFLGQAMGPNTQYQGLRSAAGAACAAGAQAQYDANHHYDEYTSDQPRYKRPTQ